MVLLDNTCNRFIFRIVHILLCVLTFAKQFWCQCLENKNNTLLHVTGFIAKYRTIGELYRTRNKDFISLTAL